MIANPRIPSVIAVTVTIASLVGCGGDELGRTGSTSSSSSTSSTSGGGGAGGTGATGAGGSGGSTTLVNHPPIITSPGELTVDEEQPLSVNLVAGDPDGDPLRLFLTDLPPGALWDEATRQLSFTPDFIQGGHAWTVTATADDGKARAQTTFTITAKDTIHPPAPTIVKSEPLGGFTRLTVAQVTDTYLDSPGGAGNGKQPWNAESGYAGKLDVPGDTGWDGAIAGAINRSLRWDATRTVDTLDAFSVPITVLDGQGGAPPKAGYPTTGDKLDGTAPVKVDVTLRRAQAFRCKPGEAIAWTFGAASGKVIAGASGDVTIPVLAVTTGWTVLSLTRSP
jgi:Big-like domain-containing protein